MIDSIALGVLNVALFSGESVANRGIGSLAVFGEAKLVSISDLLWPICQGHAVMWPGNVAPQPIALLIGSEPLEIDAI